MSSRERFDDGGGDHSVLQPLKDFRLFTSVSLLRLYFQCSARDIKSSSAPPGNNG